MGFKYTHRVYNDVQDTTATEQQVLALLAHFADDKTGQCFPSIETLARQSHLHRVTVIRCLDSLKEKGYLKWISGGRKKSGRVLSNLYKLTLPKHAPKRDKTVLSEFWEDVDNSSSRVAQRYGYPLHSATPHSCTALPPTVAQCNPIIYRSSIEHPGDHNPPPEASGEGMPGRFNFGVARRDGTLDDVMKKIDAAYQETKRREEMTLLQLAVHASGKDDVENRKTFVKVMMNKNAEDCREEIYRFESERSAGEFGKIQNLAALLTKRLAALPDRAR
ncbi:MAG: helix-turn-helix domain-containing protein [Kiritimatiellae bacterium]|nr:helix-turn-helix domain-containing protein [Kiritimatiellia bacterium]